MWNRGIIVSVALAVMIITQSAYSENLPLGGAINVLNGYGHLAQSIKAMPGNMSEKRIYRGPVIPVFSIPSLYLLSMADVRIRMVMAHVRTVYCPDVNALITEYFHRFNFEGINQTARVFNERWSPAMIASHFGINEAFVGNGYCYVFLGVVSSKTRQQMVFPSHMFDVDRLVAKNARSVVANDPMSTEKFINNVGTHYISYFTTGDSLYQVFVLDGESCLEQEEVAQLKNQEETTRFSFHDKAVHVGKIRAASGNRTLEKWAAKNLVIPSRVSKSIPSLGILRTNLTLNGQLDGLLRDEALLEMELKTLAPVFRSLATRKWFTNYLNQRLKKLEASL